MRALVTEPRMLVADEPTGSLDPLTGTRVLQLLLALNRERGTTLLMVTHDLSLAQQMQRCLRVENGRLSDA